METVWVHVGRHFHLQRFVVDKQLCGWDFETEEVKERAKISVDSRRGECLSRIHLVAVPVWQFTAGRPVSGFLRHLILHAKDPVVQNLKSLKTNTNTNLMDNGSNVESNCLRPKLSLYPLFCALAFAAFLGKFRESRANLSIELGARSEPVLSWTTSSSPFYVLEEVAQFGPHVWGVIPTKSMTARLLNGRMQVADNRLGLSSRFFRLREAGSADSFVFVVDQKARPDYKNLVQLYLPGLADKAFVIQTTNLQQTLNSVPSNGASIILREGVYDGGVDLQSRTILIGGGAASTVLKAPIGQRNCINVVGDDVIISGLGVDGQRDSQPSQISTESLCGITIRGARVKILNCYVHDTRNIGIHAVAPARDLLVENCVIQNSATNNQPGGTLGYHFTGLYCNRVGSPIIRSNTISGWSQAVGLWYGTANAIVEGNTIIDNFGFRDDAHTIPRSACEDYGADVATHGRNLWTNNVVDGTTLHCMEIASGVIGSSYVNNVFRRPGQISNQGSHFVIAGTRGQVTTDILLEGNQIYSSGLRNDTCSISGEIDRIGLVKNDFRGFNLMGSSGPFIINPLIGAKGFKLVGNTFTDCVFGIWLEGSGESFVISSNLFKSVRGRNSAITINAGHGHAIEGNQIDGLDDTVGIILQGQGGHLVSGNRISVPNQSVLCRSPDNVVQGNALSETLRSLGGVVRLDGPLALRNIITNNLVQASLNSRALLITAGADFNIFQNNQVLRGALVVGPDAGSHNVVDPN